MSQQHVPTSQQRPNNVVVPTPFLFSHHLFVPKRQRARQCPEKRKKKKKKSCSSSVGTVLVLYLLGSDTAVVFTCSNNTVKLDCQTAATVARPGHKTHAAKLSLTRPSPLRSTLLSASSTESTYVSAGADALGKASRILTANSRYLPVAAVL